MKRILALFLMVSALAFVPAQPAVVYQADFNQDAEGWLGAFSNNGYAGPQTWVEPLTWQPEGYVISKSLYPHEWWPDGNQACSSPFYQTTGERPCRDWLAMVAYKYVDAPLNLDGVTVSVRLRSPGGIAYAGQRVYLWLQSVNPANGKGVNYLVVQHPVLLTPDWSIAEFTLEPADMECAGASSLRADTYDCSLSAAEVLSDVNVDMIWAMTPINPARVPVGEVHIDYVRVTR